MDIRLAVLDIAGTTVRDDGQVPAAFWAALAAHGVDLTADQVRQVRGASKRQAILSLLPEGPDLAARAEAAYADFRDELARRYRETATPIVGAAGAVDALRGRGIFVALNTGFDRGITTMLLDALGWGAGMFDAVVCGDEVEAGRPAPDLIRAAMNRVGVTDPGCVASAGDTVLDVRAGHAAGVRVNVAVLSGAHAREMLEAERPTHLIGSVAELPGLLHHAHPRH
ncbi:MAG: HAD family hydrolase [Vicinamibacterales bacterium]